MYIFNTTYHAETAVKDDFTAWLRQVYIPAATLCGRLTAPQLCRVIAGETSEGENFSLQFRVTDRRTLEVWYDKTGADLDLSMRKRFGNRVLGFNTLLEILD